MLRHGAVPLVLVALLAPLVPVASSPMTCCRGTGEACACPIQAGFTRCPTEEAASSTMPIPPAVLPPESPALALSVSPEALIDSSERLASRSPRPLDPPPRA